MCTLCFLTGSYLMIQLFGQYALLSSQGLDEKLSVKYRARADSIKRGSRGKQQAWLSQKFKNPPNNVCKAH